ncbi:hypothetical protein PVK06_022460 [Gossypium arboreum]|uniref:Phospholipase D C-terminal domain-containing protein n=1 Tax=Gossypium arboreum TaxID=29729 RepID=A0ABR0P8F2_GOSAR|nr:hypothetical protein PVK06_022460 [Gossypium arboreum]
MEMMYKDVVQVPHANGIKANPKDYLSFFCLGNREKDLWRIRNSKKTSTSYQLRWSSAIHAFHDLCSCQDDDWDSSVSTVDDECIITGSANINQRSIDGAKDTEIAMGAYQPYRLSTKEPVRGQIHGLRMALWYEHLRKLDKSFLEPESLEFVRKVVEEYWDLYACESLDNKLLSHLLSYPIGVSSDGEVKELAGLEYLRTPKVEFLNPNLDPSFHSHYLNSVI